MQVSSFRLSRPSDGSVELLQQGLYPLLYPTLEHGQHTLTALPRSIDSAVHPQWTVNEYRLWDCVIIINGDDVCGWWKPTDGLIALSVGLFWGFCLFIYLNNIEARDRDLMLTGHKGCPIKLKTRWTLTSQRRLGCFRHVNGLLLSWPLTFKI